MRADSPHGTGEFSAAVRAPAPARARPDVADAGEHLVALDSLVSLQREIAALSRASERSGGQPVKLRQTGGGPHGTVRVRIDSASASLGSREVVAVLHHDGDSTSVKPCAPLSAAQLQRLEQARALCEHCRTVRPRKRTWLLRDRSSGETLQAGSACLKPLTGAASVADALRHARLPGEASARLKAAVEADAERRRVADGDRYIDPTTFLAHVAAVIRTQGWYPASHPRATWRRALERMTAEETLEPLHLRRARETRAWADSHTDADDAYRTRLRNCLANDRLSSRELALAASGVRAYNRTLQREIRRAKSRPRSRR